MRSYNKLPRYSFDPEKLFDLQLEVMKNRPPTELYLTKKQFARYQNKTRLPTYRGIPIRVTE